MMNEATAIADDELRPLLAALERFDLVVLAVSGGADSMALLHLVARWRAGRTAGPSVEVVTVDHALRVGSRAEAEAVGIAARALGLRHHVLVWDGCKPATGLQDAARQARYRLLGDLLESLGSRNAALVTGHTADDQAETLLMRLARGSGVDGLAAMPGARWLQAGLPIMLMRPLLGISRERLEATLRARGLSWVDDPSNANSAFERVRLRAAAPQLAALGLTARPLSASAARLQRARDALDWATRRLEADVLETNAGAFATLDRERFAAAPAELRLRVLGRVLARFGGASPPARLQRVEALVQRLEAGLPVTATLGGCVVAATARELRVFREPGRQGLPECPIVVGDQLVWDHRFLVRAEGSTRRPLRVRALGAGGYASLRSELPRPLPARAGATLPAIWADGDLVAVPLLPLPPGLLTPPHGLRVRTDFLGVAGGDRICD